MILYCGVSTNAGVVIEVPDYIYGTPGRQCTCGWAHVDDKFSTASLQHCLADSICRGSRQTVQWVPLNENAVKLIWIACVTSYATNCLYPIELCCQVQLVSIWFELDLVGLCNCGCGLTRWKGEPSKTGLVVSMFLAHIYGNFSGLDSWAHVIICTKIQGDK